MEIEFNKKEEELIEKIGVGLEFHLYHHDDRRILETITGKKLGKQVGFTQVRVLKITVPGYYRRKYGDYIKSKKYYFDEKSTEKALREILKEIKKSR